MHFPAAEVVFERETIASIAGAEFAATLDDVPLTNWSTFRAAAGSSLRFLGKVSGNRAYLAIRGGLEIKKWLGSASTNLAASFGGFHGRRLQNGDTIETKNTAFDRKLLGRTAAPSLLPFYRPFPTVRVIAGAEYSLLDPGSRVLFGSQDYLISPDSNRMGFRLGGGPLALTEKIELLSSAVSDGTVQLLPDGQMIVLMAAHQTTGGYPRIAHVVSRDLPLIAQLGPGDKVAFHIVDIRHAEELAVEFEREMTMFRGAASSHARA
jgi:antagonist of KipI